jgi:hypothetical protein
VELDAATGLWLGLALRLFLILAPGRLVLPAAAAVSVYAVSYACILWAVFKNRRLPGFLVAGTGMVLNCIAIFGNGGKMPVSATALARVQPHDTVVVQGLSFTHQLITTHTRFAYLADVLTAPPLFANVFSIGDLFLAAGVFYFIIATATRRPAAG